MKDAKNDLMSPEAIMARQERKRILRDAAERDWDAAGHEGDAHEKEYYIRGYISAIQSANYIYPQIAELLTQELKKI
jgi:hypothetical protein